MGPSVEVQPFTGGMSQPRGPLRAPGVPRLCSVTMGLLELPPLPPLRVRAAGLRPGSRRLSAALRPEAVVGGAGALPNSFQMWPGSPIAWLLRGLDLSLLVGQTVRKAKPNEGTKGPRSRKGERGRGGWTRRSRAPHLFPPRGLPAGLALNVGWSQLSAGCLPAGAPTKGAPQGLEGAASTVHLGGRCGIPAAAHPDETAA